MNENCKAYNADGLCSACFKGYDLVNGACVSSPRNNAQPADLGCARWDWDNQVCLECSKGWTANSDKKCTPVNDQCSSWNTKGSCLSCFPGYIVSGTTCTQSNPLCKSVNSNGACLSCYTGYVLFNNNCTPIKQLASLYLYYAQCCPEKL